MHVSTRPLDGVLIADHTTLGPGAYTTELLARLGARVVKFEPPGGDPSRRIPGLWHPFNGGKQSVLCDLKQEGDRELALAVVARADAFVASWRPGVAERLGLGAEDLLRVNPRIVHCSLTGFGSSGELMKVPGHELNYLAASGALKGIMGESLGHPGLPIGDTAAGMFAALRIVSAIVDARASGRGSSVRVSVAGVLAEFASIGAGASDSILSATAVNPAYGQFVTADGQRIVLGVLDEQPFWEALCDALGMTELRALRHQEQLQRGAELRELVRARIASLDLTALRARFSGSTEIPWNLVEDADAVDIPDGVPTAPSAPPELDAQGSALREEFLS